MSSILNPITLPPGSVPCLNYYCSSPSMENRPSSRHPSFAFFIILTEVADPNSTPTFISPVTVPVARGCRFLHPTFHSCRRNSSVSVFVVKVQSITNFEQEEDGQKWSDPIALNSCTNGYSRVPGFHSLLRAGLWCAREKNNAIPGRGNLCLLPPQLSLLMYTGGASNISYSCIAAKYKAEQEYWVW